MAAVLVVLATNSYWPQVAGDKIATVTDSSLGRAAQLVNLLLRCTQVSGKARGGSEGRTDTDDTSRPPPQQHGDNQSLGRVAPVFSFSFRLSFAGLRIAGSVVKVSAPPLGKNPFPCSLLHCGLGFL